MNNAARAKLNALLLERRESFVKVRNGPFPEQQAFLISAPRAPQRIKNTRSRSKKKFRVSIKATSTNWKRVPGGQESAPTGGSSSSRTSAAPPLGARRLLRRWVSEWGSNVIEQCAGVAYICKELERRSSLARHSQRTRSALQTLYPGSPRSSIDWMPPLPCVAYLCMQQLLVFDERL